MKKSKYIPAFILVFLMFSFAFASPPAPLFPEQQQEAPSFLSRIQSLISNLFVGITGRVIQEEEEKEMTVTMTETQQEPIVSTFGSEGEPIDPYYTYKVEEALFVNESSGEILNITNAILRGWAISTDGTLGGVFHAWVPEIPEFVTIDPTSDLCIDYSYEQRQDPIFKENYPHILCELESWRGYFFNGGANGISLIFAE